MPASHSLTLAHLYNAFNDNRPLDHARLVAKAVRAGADDLLSAIQSHVLGDDWLDFAYAAQNAYWVRQQGTVYVVTNAIHRDFFKVGKTKVDMPSRLKQLNNEAVVGEFVCVRHWPVHDRHYLEKAAHRMLAHLPQHKEFFVGDRKDIEAAVTSAIHADQQRFRSSGFPLPETDK